MNGFASDMYGPSSAPALAQATGGPEAPHAYAGAPAPHVRTKPTTPAAGMHSPALAIVVVLGLAILLSQVTFSGTIKVSA